jgi:hypothetical protein
MGPQSKTSWPRSLSCHFSALRALSSLPKVVRFFDLGERELTSEMEFSSLLVLVCKIGESSEDHKLALHGLLASTTAGSCSNEGSVLAESSRRPQGSICGRPQMATLSCQRRREQSRASRSCYHRWYRSPPASWLRYTRSPPADDVQVTRANSKGTPLSPFQTTSSGIRSHWA